MRWRVGAGWLYRGGGSKPVALARRAAGAQAPCLACTCPRFVPVGMCEWLVLTSAHADDRRDRRCRALCALLCAVHQTGQWGGCHGRNARRRAVAAASWEGTPSLRRTAGLRAEAGSSGLAAARESHLPCNRPRPGSRGARRQFQVAAVAAAVDGPKPLAIGTCRAPVAATTSHTYDRPCGQRCAMALWLPDALQTLLCSAAGSAGMMARTI